MRKVKCCFISQFPPPVHGLSKAVQTLYNSELQEVFSFEKVNITSNKEFIKNLFKIKKSSADIFYFTISQSIIGNIRDLLILKVLSINNKRCIIHLHGGYYRKLLDNDMGIVQKKANYRALSKVSGAIVLGKSFEPIFDGLVPKDKIYIVPNCVDDEYLMKDEEFNIKLKFSSKRKVKHILYLSNFIRSKGYLEVLKIAVLEKERCCLGEERKLHFDFAGKFFEKSEEKYFFDFINNNKLEDYITYHGIVDGEKKKKLLKNCDIFILLTKYKNEGQPISILEAMGNGMMIVATEHAGIPDIVMDKVNGIVSNDNYFTIYEKILDKLNDNLIEIQSLNRKIIKKNHTEIIYKTSIAGIFNKIISGER